MSIIPETVDLPSGGTVTFHDPEDLTGDDYRTIMTGLKVDLSSFLDQPTANGAAPSEREITSTLAREGGMAAMTALQHNLAVMLVASWTIPYTPKGTDYAAGEVPIPERDPTVLGRLRMRDYRAITEAVLPALKVFNPGPVTPDDANVPGSPTVPVGG